MKADSEAKKQKHTMKAVNSKTDKILKMTTDLACTNKTIAWIAAVAAKECYGQYWQKEEMEMNLPGTEVKKQVWDPS